MIPLGWFHTILGVIALISGAVALFKFKEISLSNGLGRTYLLATLITAGTALLIFQRGVFGPGHALAILTLLALLVGTVAATTVLFGKLSRYIQAIAYTGTLLFHCIPAITDGLLRLPVGNPILSSFDDPVLKICYLILLVLYLIGISFQLRWIHKQSA